MESSAWSWSPGWLLGGAALVVSIAALLVALSQDAGGAPGLERYQGGIGKTKVVMNRREAPAKQAFAGAQARCPAGWVAVGGGFFSGGSLAGGGAEIISSTRKSGSPRTWFVQVGIPPGAVDRQYAAQAICVKQ